MKNILLISALLLFNVFSSYATEDVSKYVDPFIGTEGGGNVFPGAAYPFGMVKLGPDCGDKDWNAGWDSNGNIHGFSHVHVSGTGGGCKYGNVLMLPLVGDIQLNDYSSERVNEQVSLGEYSVGLARYNTSARLTVSKRSGFHEYTFPDSESSKVLIDLGSFLQSHEKQLFVGSEVKVISNTEIEGYTRIRGGWNEGGEYTIYFYAKFDTPANSFGTWKSGKIYEGQNLQFDSNEKTGAYFQYKTVKDQKIKVKVGISFLSTERAKVNMQDMNSWNFSEIKGKTVDEWNKILEKVSLKGSETDKKIFYTALYHSYLQPVDRTGENPKWKSDEPYYDDFYAIWDTFRATHPLFTLLTPSKQVEMIRALIDIYKFEGYMPDARSGNDNGRVQAGSDCDILIADALVKGLQGFDYEEAFRSMIKNAEVPPGGDERKEGRGGLRDYNTIGYVSTDFERAGSRTFEYSNCDYAIATVAKYLGKKDLEQKYLKRSENWTNLWNPNIESLGFKGFIWPRDKDGRWWEKDEFDALRGGTWPDFFYETFSWEMSLYVPHDINKLIEFCGGKDMFMKRLDTYFTYEKWDQRFYMGLFQISNEPGFLVPCYYNYVNRPDKTAEITRKVLKTRYKVTKDGIPGNDDSGSMSSWYVFHSLGFYPNAGQDVYLISSPIFEEAVLTLENGKELKITAKNVSDKNIYVQSVKLNGRDLDRCWLKHSEIGNGATLEFVMGNKKSDWAVRGELPPSASLK